MQQGRVLALQSHVVRGHVGADAFSFPLQQLGLDVGCIYTCQFVDLFIHQGSQLEPQQLAALLKHLPPEAFSEQPPAAAAAAAGKAEEPPFRYVASGFVGRADLLQVFAAWLQKTRGALGPVHAPLFMCDPVLGDCNKLYVHPSCIGSYCMQLLPLADIITPNQYEAGWLLAHHTEQQQQQQQQQQQEEAAGWQDSSSIACVALDSWPAVLTALEGLHALGPEIVVITSVELPAAAAAEASNMLAAAAAQQQQRQQQQEECLFVVASRKARQPQRCGCLCERPTTATAAAAAAGEEGEAADVVYVMQVPKLSGYMGGSGDLFAALFLGFFVKEQQNLKKTLEYAVNAVQGVLGETFSKAPRPQTVDPVACAALLQEADKSLKYNAVRVPRSSSSSSSSS
ncbi:hypothetical protein Efla_002360 [Eimeria flavescens]